MNSVDDLIRGKTAQQVGTEYLIHNPYEFISLLNKDLAVARNYVTYSLNSEELRALLKIAYRPSPMGLSYPFFSKMIEADLDGRSDLIITLLERLDNRTLIDSEDLLEAFRTVIRNSSYDLCAALLRHLSCESAILYLTQSFSSETDGKKTISYSIKFQNGFISIPPSLINSYPNKNSELLDLLITKLPHSSIALSQAIAVLEELNSLNPEEFIKFIQRPREEDLIGHLIHHCQRANCFDLVNLFYAINPVAIRRAFPQTSIELPLSLAPPPYTAMAEQLPSAPPITIYDNLHSRLPSVTGLPKDRGGFTHKMTKDYTSAQNVVIDALDDENHSLRKFFQPKRDARIRFEEELKRNYQQYVKSDYAIEPYQNFNRKNRAAKQFFGALQPIADMWKDFSLLKPFKIGKDVYRDILPIRILLGTVNVVKGLGILVLTPVVSTVYLISDLRTLPRGPGTYFKQNLIHFGYAASWLLDGVAHFIRGTTEIACSPLTQLRAIPFALFRSQKSMLDNTGFKSTLSTSTAQALSLKEGSETIPAPLFASLYELHRKRDKAADCNQFLYPGSADNNNANRWLEEDQKFSALVNGKSPVKTRVDAYLGVFKSKMGS